jgi:hypothetical protein
MVCAACCKNKTSSTTSNLYRANTSSWTYRCAVMRKGGCEQAHGEGNAHFQNVVRRVGITCHSGKTHKNKDLGTCVAYALTRTW